MTVTLEIYDDDVHAGVRVAVVNFPIDVLALSRREALALAAQLLAEYLDAHPPD